jgi:hypothetical protein
MALSCLGPRPDRCQPFGSSSSTGSSEGRDPAGLVRLVALPEACTYAHLVQLLVRGLPPTQQPWPAPGLGDAPPVRIAYCLPSLPVVVDVADDEDVRLMWEEAVEHQGTCRSLARTQPSRATILLLLGTSWLVCSRQQVAGRLGHPGGTECNPLT